MDLNFEGTITNVSVLPSESEVVNVLRAIKIELLRADRSSIVGSVTRSAEGITYMFKKQEGLSKISGNKRYMIKISFVHLAVLCVLSGDLTFPPAR